MDYPVDVAFGLAFNVEPAPDTMSRFRPAQVDGSKTELFAGLRLRGFAALLRLNFAKKLVTIGGLNRAEAIYKMLVDDLGIDSARVEHFKSEPNTNGNVKEIKKRLDEEELRCCDCAVVSNFYHLPRVSMFLERANIPMRAYPAEAFLLWEKAEENRKQLVDDLRGGDLAKRMAGEIQGIADMLRGAYK